MLKLALALFLVIVTLTPSAASDQWPMGRLGAATTIASGCGTSAGISGFDSGGIVTLGGGAITSCVIAFSGTYSPALRCVVQPLGLAVAPAVAVSTTQITVTATLTGGTSLVYHCVSA